MVIEGWTLVHGSLDVLINGGNILIIGKTRLRVTRLVGLGEDRERPWEYDELLGTFLPPYEIAATSSLFFLNKPEDHGGVSTRAIFPCFKLCSIVSPILTISVNFAPTSNMIL